MVYRTEVTEEFWDPNSGGYGCGRQPNLGFKIFRWKILDLGALRAQVVPKTQTNWYVPPLCYVWGGDGPGVAVWGRLGLSGGGCLADEKKGPPLSARFLEMSQDMWFSQDCVFFLHPIGTRKKHNLEKITCLGTKSLN